MEGQIEQKLELTRQEAQDLRIFFMIGKKVVPILEERVMFSLAFKLEEAFEKIKLESPGYLLLYTGQNMTVKELLEGLQFNKVVSPPTNKEESIREEPLPPEQLNFEQFRNCLLLVAEEYVKPEDQERLKEIIKELKYKEKKI